MKDVIPFQSRTQALPFWPPPFRDGGVRNNSFDSGGNTHSMVRVVEAKTANSFHLLARKGRKQLFHRKNGVCDLRGGVKSRSRDLVCLDGLLVPSGKTDCTTSDIQTELVEERKSPHHRGWGPLADRYGLVQSRQRRNE